jgi:transposase
MPPAATEEGVINVTVLYPHEMICTRRGDEYMNTRLRISEPLRTAAAASMVAAVGKTLSESTCNICLFLFRGGRLSMPKRILYLITMCESTRPSATRYKRLKTLRKREQSQLLM